MEILKRLGLWATLALSIFAGPAWSLGYNILLKTAGAPSGVNCGTGGFDFTKSNIGVFPVSGASVTLPPGCVSAIPASFPSASGTLSAVVQNVTLTKQSIPNGPIEPLFQGPNVGGLQGTMQVTTNTPGNCQGASNGQSAKTLTITFNYTVTDPPNPANRTFTITCQGPGNNDTSTANGLYHVFNQQSIPEPQSLWLITALLGALVLVSWKSQRRHGLN